MTLFGIALSGAAALLAGSQTWISFTLAGTEKVETVTGHEANAALSPISIAMFAAALALTIAGPVFRRVLGLLVALLGAGLVALTSGVIAAPVAAVSSRITELTGIAGEAAGASVAWSSVSAWAWVSVAAGVAAILLGAIVLLFSGRWRSAGRKYDSDRRAPGGDGAEPDRISEWDSLSRGEDPSEDIR
ncbi:Trp biosynthesis-associated membrane protein [Leucobacter sp. wl10]|uniref:Trp biosynthesis-associated membrane protein n=1 Tax=Leucobacter sp. wl10 TaxID=2304677 RepID=UPI001F09B230|nr:Trp biosynthesis-associated membrane protein [Leucobacter sp. wl10]